MRFKKLLLVLPILALCLVMINTANAAVDPDASMNIVAPSSVPDVGHTFTVNITVVNVDAMWGWSCVINWNSTVVNCTGKQVGPFNPSGTSLIGVIDNVNGKIPKLSSYTTEEDTVTGSGIVCFLTFEAKALGDVNLNVSTANYADLLAVHKYDFAAVNQAIIIVVPEFPTLLVMPLFFVITAAIAIMTKKRWMKKY